MTHHYFTNNKEFQLKKSLDKHQYHTLRYDFKPASVNSDEPAALELTQNGQVTIKAPNVGGSSSSSSSYTVFRGQRRPHVKECLLVIDNRTGEMVLQKLTDNITVKATRSLSGAGGGGTATATESNNHANANNRNSSTKSNIDGPQLSEESSSSSDDDSSDSSSSSSSSSDDSQSENSSQSNDEGFTF